MDYFRNHSSIEIALIVCNNPGAGVLNIAEKENVPFIVIRKKEFQETGYVEELKQYKIQFIVLAGFLWKVPPVLIRAFPSGIINIHPALLPMYGGKGMYGMAVHTAVINAREVKSGITIHYVNEEYDEGTIILQAEVAITPEDSPETLAAKIHQLEYTHLSPVIEKIVLSGTL